MNRRWLLFCAALLTWIAVAVNPGQPTRAATSDLFAGVTYDPLSAEGQVISPPADLYTVVNEPLLLAAVYGLARDQPATTTVPYIRGLSSDMIATTVYRPAKTLAAVSFFDVVGAAGYAHRQLVFKETGTFTLSVYPTLFNGDTVAARSVTVHVLPSAPAHLTALVEGQTVAWNVLLPLYWQDDQGRLFAPASTVTYDRPRPLYYYLASTQQLMTLTAQQTLAKTLLVPPLDGPPDKPFQAHLQITVGGHVFTGQFTQGGLQEGHDEVGDYLDAPVSYPPQPTHQRRFLWYRETGGQRELMQADTRSRFYLPAGGGRSRYQVVTQYTTSATTAAVAFAEAFQLPLVSSGDERTLLTVGVRQLLHQDVRLALPWTELTIDAAGPWQLWVTAKPVSDGQHTLAAQWHLGSAFANDQRHPSLSENWVASGNGPAILPFEDPYLQLFAQPVVWRGQYQTSLIFELRQEPTPEVLEK
ncbi:hypothetical protein [Lacticaseibacillus mingshuiensis]|uniref:Uncharacterized protein n=1 Tax=Lacticaseibacillus mingshuiensis TaxID=2799574 RepID=A0ABW4CKV3_9LACO|nr:hypothetical protein [Lacticaseibacillus mingshuiensis]